MPLCSYLCSPFEGSCPALCVSAGLHRPVDGGTQRLPRWPACTPEVPQSVPASPSAPHGWMTICRFQASGAPQLSCPAGPAGHQPPRDQGLCVLFVHYSQGHLPGRPRVTEGAGPRHYGVPQPDTSKCYPVPSTKGNSPKNIPPFMPLPVMLAVLVRLMHWQIKGI